MTDLFASVWPWSPVLLPLALLIALGAGVVRGFAGFGFAALVVAGLTPFVPPGPVVVAALVLEVLASLALLRSVAPQVDRQWLVALLVGNGVCIPLGMAALAWLPVLPLRMLVATTLLAGAVAMRLVEGHRFRATRALRGLAGGASGLLNGLAASGGVIAAMLMASTRIEPAVMRATMITFLFYISLYAFACALALSLAGPAAPTRLLGWDTVRWVLVLWPTMRLGMRIGVRAFGGAPANRYRRFVLDLLIAVSALGLANAALTSVRG